MKYHLLLLSIILTIFSPISTAKFVQNFFINGINNSEENAIKSAEVLSEAFHERHGVNLIDTQVIPIYNISEGFLKDLIESSDQKTGIDQIVSVLADYNLLTTEEKQLIYSSLESEEQRTVFLKLIKIYTSLNDNTKQALLAERISTISLEENDLDSINQVIHLRGDLYLNRKDVTTLREIGEFHIIASKISVAAANHIIERNLSSKKSFSTQEKITSELLTAINNGYGANAVAHSQGNFFAINAEKSINRPYAMKLISVGSPVNEKPYSGEYYNLSEDAVVNITKPNLGSNLTNIKLYDFTVNNDLLGHNFNTAYMGEQSRSRNLILDTFAKHYLELGGETYDKILYQPKSDRECSEILERLKVSYIFSDSIAYSSHFYNNKCTYYGDDRHIITYDPTTEALDRIYLEEPLYQTLIDYSTLPYFTIIKNQRESFNNNSLCQRSLLKNPLLYDGKCIYFDKLFNVKSTYPYIGEEIEITEEQRLEYQAVLRLMHNLKRALKDPTWRIQKDLGLYGEYIGCGSLEGHSCKEAINSGSKCTLLWGQIVGNQDGNTYPQERYFSASSPADGICQYKNRYSKNIIVINTLTGTIENINEHNYYSLATNEVMTITDLQDLILNKSNRINPFTNGDQCLNLITDIFPVGVPSYLDAYRDTNNSNVCNFKHSILNKIVKLDTVTQVLEIVDLTKIEAQYDTQLLNNKGENISSTNDCTIFWQQNNVERDVIGSKKFYEPLFYGNKCLYFRGDSFIIEYDTPTKQAKYLSYGDNHYDEYQAVFKFVTNINKAQIDPDFRKKLGLLLNKHGVVGCSYSNKEFCTPVYAGDSKYKALYQTHPEDCSILWNIVTESGIMDHEAYPSKSNIGSNLQTAHRCVYKPQEHNGNGMNGDHAILIQYDFLTGEVITNQKKTDNMYDMYLKLIQLSIKHKETNSWSDDYVKLENKNSLFILNGIPICSPDFYKPTSWYPNYPGYEIYKKDGCQNDINGIYSSYSIDWSDACQSIISALYPNDPLLKNRTSAKTSRVNDYLTFDIFNNDIICAFSKDAQSIAIDDNHIYFHSNMYQSNGNFSKFTLGSQRFY